MALQSTKHRLQKKKVCAQKGHNIPVHSVKCTRSRKCTPFCSPKREYFNRRKATIQLPKVQQSMLKVFDTACNKWDSLLHDQLIGVFEDVRKRQKFFKIHVGKKLECCSLCFYGRVHEHGCTEIPSHFSVQNIRNYLKSLPTSLCHAGEVCSEPLKLIRVAQSNQLNG